VGDPAVLIAVVSVKGSPGASTLGLGLAARWPQPGAVLVEADPAGGDLAARFGLYHKPGLSTMALDTRSLQAKPQPGEWTQRLPCGVAVVLAGPGPAAAASLTTLGGRLPQLLRLLAGQYPAVVVDAGRWQPATPADLLLRAADVVLLVARPTSDEIRQVDARIQALHELASDVRLVLVGVHGAWPAREIAAALHVPVAQVVPVDRRGAGLLAGRLVPRRGWASPGWTRLPLLCACRSLARQLSGPSVLSGSGTARPRSVPPRWRSVNGQAVNR
jgi:MinD-like ATPase involved in chromosome partitioning or flagellar assembly